MIQQTKILPASEVKNNFGAILSQVRSGKFAEVIVENRGEPIVAIVNMEELQIVRAFRERGRQKEALEKLRKVRTRAQARVKGKLTDQEADAIAGRFSRELVEDLENEGKITFERKTS